MVHLRSRGTVSNVFMEDMANNTKSILFRNLDILFVISKLWLLCSYEALKFHINLAFKESVHTGDEGAPRLTFICYLKVRRRC